MTQMSGAEGTRTPDPHTASVVRYQLRHSPKPTRLRQEQHPAERAETQVYTAAEATPKQPTKPLPKQPPRPDTPRQHPRIR